MPSMSQKNEVLDTYNSDSLHSFAFFGDFRGDFYGEFNCITIWGKTEYQKS